jgi:hypothetical protein
VRAKRRIVFQNIHDAQEMAGGRVEQRGRFAVQRNVKMDAPLVGKLRVEG